MHAAMLCIHMDATPVIVVLAAGLGSRFSGAGHKLAQALGQTTVLGLTLSNAIGSGLPVVVVTTQHLLPEVSRLLAGSEIVLVDDVGHSGALFGMGHSIAAGVAARPQASGWLILPADMPMVKSSTLRAVANGLAHHPVVFAQHQGRRGHPVGFSAELYSELVQLTGDEGARRITSRYPSYGVEAADAGVLIDIDTPSDLTNAQRSLTTVERAER